MTSQADHARKADKAAVQLEALRYVATFEHFGGVCPTRTLPEWASHQRLQGLKRMGYVTFEADGWALTDAGYDRLAGIEVPASARKRFREKYAVDPATGCWTWVAVCDRQGYGCFWLHQRFVGAHRAAYELFVGPIPEGLELDHLCRNRRCVNPAHLEAVTRRENMLRGISPLARNAAKTHCVNGHPFDEANTYHRPQGGRQCRQCQAEFLRRFRRKHARVAA